MNPDHSEQTTIALRGEDVTTVEPDSISLRLHADGHWHTRGWYLKQAIEAKAETLYERSAADQELVGDAEIRDEVSSSS